MLEYLQHHVKSQLRDTIINVIQVDEKTVSVRRFVSSKHYPCAQIYEYSKLCLLLFSYELHRQLTSVGKSWHVSVMYVITVLWILELCKPILCEKFLQFYLVWHSKSNIFGPIANP